MDSTVGPDADPGWPAAARVHSDADQMTAAERRRSRMGAPFVVLKRAPSHDLSLRMSFLIIDAERFALPIGETTLGGTGDDALPTDALAHMPAFAVVAVWPDAVATIRALIPRPAVLVNGAELGDQPSEIHHGSRIEIAGRRILYGDLRSVGSTADVVGVTDDELALLDAELPGEPTADTGGRLIVQQTGAILPIPDSGLTMGRDPTCDVVLAEKGVSRRHAVIKPSLQGYVLDDTSMNGIQVNGRTVHGTRLLGRGDVLRIGEAEFCFEADPASFEPAPELLRRAEAPESPVFAATPGLATTQPGTNPLLATLEILNDGSLKGKRFRIERPLAHIGRSAHNDVRLADSSVSGSHATLMLRGGNWYVSDHESTNGTYIDGERMDGERIVKGVAELRVGNIKMVFRPIGVAPRQTDSTRAIVGVPSEDDQA